MPEMNEIIAVQQLPVIVEQLYQIKEDVERRTADALSLECTEATVRDVKKERAELNKLFADFEARRRDVKNQIMAPYDAFETVYRDCITNPFRFADAQLAGKINNVEQAVKDGKREALKTYFEEYRESLGLRPEDAPFDKARLNVTLSASMKSLKKAASDALDRVAEDIAMIRENEFADEIMAEYRRCGNASLAVTIVGQRRREIEAERKRAEEDNLVAQLREKYEAEVNEAARETVQNAPDVAEEVVIPEEEKVPVNQPVADESEVYEVAFTVRGTIEQIRALKKFLVEGGYQYDN